MTDTYLTFIDDKYIIQNDKDNCQNANCICQKEGDAWC